MPRGMCLSLMTRISMRCMFYAHFDAVIPGVLNRLTIITAPRSAGCSLWTFGSRSWPHSRHGTAMLGVEMVCADQFMKPHY